MKDRVRVITKRTRGRSLAQIALDLRSYLVGWKDWECKKVCVREAVS